jgi:hypothetical protein
MKYLHSSKLFRHDHYWLKAWYLRTFLLNKHHSKHKTVCVLQSHLPDAHLIPTCVDTECLSERESASVIYKPAYGYCCFRPMTLPGLQHSAFPYLAELCPVERTTLLTAERPMTPPLCNTQFRILLCARGMLHVKEALYCPVFRFGLPRTVAEFGFHWGLFHFVF